MNATAPLKTPAIQPKPLSGSNHAGLQLQRKCACGSPTASLTGSCPECGSKRRLQTKLRVGASNDPLEQEADQVADQVLAAPAHSAISGSPPRIQRFSGQVSGQSDAAPASVDRVLASPGSPLAPALRSDMEKRFGHDFSRVRVHSDALAQQSALDVNAKAYTVGQDIVFGAGGFEPATREGRRLIAHELAHVAQQSESILRAGSGNKKSPPIVPSAHLFRKAVNSAKLIDNPTRVERLIIDGAEKTITMLTNQGAFRYGLDICNVTQGDYIAGVTYDEKKSTVTFKVKRFEHQAVEGESQAEHEVAFAFHWTLARSEANPALFFKEQTEVPVTVRTAGAASPAYSGIAALPAGSYVDNVKTTEYNIDAKPELTGLPLYIKAIYDDGTTLNINLYNLEDSEMSGSEIRHAIAHGYVGAGGRVFPLRMGRRTTPQLWLAREKALELMEESNIDFTQFSFNIVTLVISFPAIVAGVPPGSPVITRRITPRKNPVQRPPALRTAPVTPPSHQLSEGNTPPITPPSRQLTQGNSPPVTPPPRQLTEGSKPPVTPPSRQLGEGSSPPVTPPSRQLTGRSPSTSESPVKPTVAKPGTSKGAAGEQLGLFPELSDSAPSHPLEPVPSIPIAPGGRVPRIDVGEIKSVQGEAGGWGQINGRKYTHKIPDTGHEAVVTYDAQGNVRVKIRISGGDEKIIFNEGVGQVPKEKMPNAKYGSSEFGNEIEEPIRLILEKLTGQKFFPKAASAKGPDVLPPQPTLPMAH